jgi:hypothetical protein
MIQVLKAQIHEQRSFIHVRGHRRNDGRGKRQICRCFAVQTANDERAAGDAAIGSLVGIVDSCHRARKSGNVLNPRLLERRTANGRDADRNILDRQSAASRRNDDFLKSRIVRTCR